MTEFTVIVESDEDGWLIGSVPELPGCHSQAETMDALIERMREAIQLYLEEEPLSDRELTRFRGVQVVEV